MTLGLNPHFPTFVNDRTYYYGQLSKDSLQKPLHVSLHYDFNLAKYFNQDYHYLIRGLVDKNEGYAASASEGSEDSDVSSIEG